MPNPNNDRGFSKDFTFSDKLRKEGRSSEAFEIILSSLTLEEVIALKLECSLKITNGKLYGFNLWSKIVEIAKDALYNATISVSGTNVEIRRILGISNETLKMMKKKYDINRE
jgi:hypothetical protein